MKRNVKILALGFVISFFLARTVFHNYIENIYLQALIIGLVYFILNRIFAREETQLRL